MSKSEEFQNKSSSEQYLKYIKYLILNYECITGQPLYLQQEQDNKGLLNPYYKISEYLSIVISHYIKTYKTDSETSLHPLSIVKNLNPTNKRYNITSEMIKILKKYDVL
jgi:hypothetical protein